MGYDRSTSLDQPDVLEHLADGRLFRSVEPVHGVDLPDFRHRELLRSERSTHRNQSIDIPRIETVRTRPEVVLLPHLTSFAAGADDRLSPTPGR